MEEGFWDDQEMSKKVIDDLKDAKSLVETFDLLEESIEDLKIMITLAQEEDALEELEPDLYSKLLSTEGSMEDFRLETLLDGEYDKSGAIISIHAGAGGLEAQDWAEMLQRMYFRWVSNSGFSNEILDYHSDTEGGIKSITFSVKGRNAYGFLKGEKGVHRLVRISPYDSSGKRHTSFASIDVFPILDDDVEININEADLKIDTYRSSGAGGQHVNTTDSAVRITHLPTGIVVQCQSERSQIINRETAMKMLYAKLSQIAEEEQKEKIEDIQGKYNQIAWGSQIRSYVYNPYQMVKDHRTDYETGDISSVMDGGLDDFIREYLNWKVKTS